jgi:hypothetical protein
MGGENLGNRCRIENLDEKAKRLSLEAMKIKGIDKRERKVNITDYAPLHAPNSSAQNTNFTH